MTENEFESSRFGRSAQTKGESGGDNAGCNAGSPAPRLYEYYSDAKGKPARFIRAVRAAKVGSFAERDVAETLDQLPYKDPTLARTVGLIGNTPEVITRWIVDATRASLQHYHPEVWSHASEAASNLFDRIVHVSVEAFAVKDKTRRLRAENLLRLALVWLMDQRNLDAAGALLSLSRVTKSKRGTVSARPRADAVRVLKRAKIKHVRELATIAGLFESAIGDEARARQEACSRLVELGDRIASLEPALRSTQLELEATGTARARLSEELAALQNELGEMKQLRALDRTQQVARFRNFLTDRLDLPLSDARDALDFDTPHVEAARQRINMAIRAIAEELGKPHE